MPSSILDVITHYQRSIERSSHDEVRLLHCIEKLYKLPVTVEHLQTTGVGKTVNSLRKYNGEVGVAAKTLVAKWKAMVAAEEKDAESDEIKKAPYYDDDRENGNNSNKNSTIDKIGASSSSSTSLLENHHNSNISNHSSSSHHKSNNSNNLEGQNYVMKRKHDNSDNLSRKDEYNSSRKHHKKIKKENDLNESKYLSDNTGNKKSGSRSDLNGDRNKSLNIDDHETQEILSDIKSHIKQEKLESLEEYDDQSSTGYDDEGEKLVIDVKSKTDEDSDNNADSLENLEAKESKKHHSSTKSRGSNREKSRDYKNSHRSSRSHNEKESSSSRSKKESNDGRNSDKIKSASHHHQKSKHHDEKKSKNKNDEAKDNSADHHRSKYEKESRHRDREREKYKEKDKNKSKTDDTRSSSKSRHHDSKTSDNGSDKEKHKRTTLHDTDLKSSSPPKVKVTKNLDEGIDSSMGTSFEEALGMLNAPSSSFSSSASKSSSKTKTKSATSSDSSVAEDNFIKPSSRNSSLKTNKSNTPELLANPAKLTPLDPNIALELPTISPNYKPMPLNPTVMDCVFNNKQFQRKILSDEEALAAGISSKTIRTKVYSGAKIGQLQQVPTLFDLCIWILQKNIDALEYTGGVPFDVLKPVLELATPNQLANFEEYNPYLMEDTDILWEKICARHCRGIKRQEMETWREMYMRCQEEREERLSKLTENIKQSQKQITLPLKKTQLAYIDSMVKPPRNVLRKQEQFGTSHKKVTTPAARVASLSGLAPNIAKAPDNKMRINPGERDTAQATAHTRPKKAPLMQKTLQFMKDDDEFIPSQRLKITKSEYSLRNGIKEGIEIIPDDNKQLRINEKRRLWERRCLGLELFERNLS